MVGMSDLWHLVYLHCEYREGHFDVGSQILAEKCTSCVLFTLDFLVLLTIMTFQQPV